MGGFESRASISLLRTAMELGIRYFDAAPLYGDGTAEKVLGAAVGRDSSVIIASKVGISRPVYSPIRHGGRLAIKSLLSQFPMLKRSVIRSRARNSCNESLPTFDFGETNVRRSIEESLRFLGRSQLDVLLLHEPPAESFESALLPAISSLGMARCTGVGVGNIQEPPPGFSGVWQSRWETDIQPSASEQKIRIFHGLLRNLQSERGFIRDESLYQRLATFRQNAPSSVLIVSTTNAARLRQIVKVASKLQ